MNILNGIYKIVNTKNQKIYIGSSKNLDKRWDEHRKNLLNNKHINIKLQRAWNKYGSDSFQFQIIEQCDVSNLYDREQYYLDSLMPWKQNVGYNIGKNACGGDNISNHPDLELIREKHKINPTKMWESKSKNEMELFSKNRSGDKNGNWQGGKSIKYCCDCGKKIKVRNERCMACSKNGKNNPFFGKNHTKDTIEKLKECRKKNSHILPSNTKKIYAEGIIYDSANKAAKTLNISRMLINHRIKKQPNNYYWVV